MIRRKLTVYVLMMIAGIAAGYFFTERIRPAAAAGFLIAIGTAISLFMGITEAEKKACFAMLIFGFILFTLHFIYYENAINTVPHGSDSKSNLHIYTGRITSAENKGEYIRLTIRLTEDAGYKVSADIKPDHAGIYESTDDNQKFSAADYIGALVRADGAATELREADNPGCFDYRDYMRSKGFAFKIKLNHIEIDTVNIPKHWVLRRNIAFAREHFLSYFDEESGGFLRGVIFGDKSEINEEVLREFELNSTGHILAVSGLHIGFLHALLRFLSARRKTWQASALIIVIMLLYGEMTMWSSSAVRAIIVLSLSILSVNLRRPFDLLTSLSAAAMIILIFRPYMLLNAGFQLSFGAMLAIAFFSGHLSRYFGNLLGVTFSVQIGTVPIIAATFHRVNLISCLINIPIIALSSLLVPVCIVTLFIDILFGVVPGFLVSLIEFVSGVLVMINHRLSFEGGFSELTSGFGSAWTVTIMIIAFIFASEWFRVRAIRSDRRTLGISALLLLAPLIMIHAALYDPFGNDEIIFVAVGQGDCTHIRCGSEDVLIDGGGNDFSSVGEDILMPYLLSHGADDVDMAILTHLHKDHYLGISELSEIYPVSTVAMPKDYREYYESHKPSEKKDSTAEAISFNSRSTIYLSHDSNIRISDDVSIEVLWPDSANSRPVSADDANEHNMVYMIHYRGIKIMVTGDLLEEDELKMVKKYRGTDRLKCDILKVAHHGSKSSSSEAFLDAASPEIAVIQAGRNNIYGHPHQQTLDRLEARGISTYRTDTDGAVGVDITRNGEIRVHTMH